MTLGSYHLDLAAGAAMAGVAVALFFAVLAVTELREVARRPSRAAGGRPDARRWMTRTRCPGRAARIRKVPEGG